MIPFRDAVPSPTRPTITLALIGVGAAVMLSGSLPGGIGPASASSAWNWAWLSPVRPSDWIQAAACAAALWLFGPTVEDRVGHGRFLALYAGCAMAAAGIVASFASVPVTSIALLPGAAAGVIGAHAALYPKSRILMLLPAPRGLDVGDVPAVMLAGLWIAVQLANGIGGGALRPAWSPGLVAVQIGAGLACGALAARLLKRPERMRVEWWSP